jgi:NitT/TauT family transport system substrate-binding protein
MAIKAVMSAQDALRKNPERATEIGRRLFPPTEAGLIAGLIRRDVPFYDLAISPQSVEAMNRFAQDIGLLSGPVAYEKVVWKN